MSSSGRFLHQAIVSFDGDGRIVGVEEVGDHSIDAMEGVEYYDGVLIPGMVNGHCHLELSYLLGAVGEGGGLVEFIREITEVRGDFSAEFQEQRAIFEDRKMWSEGVQGVCDISNGVASFAAKSSSKIIYHTYGEYFNMPDDHSVEDYYAKATSHMALAQELGISISPTPHSTYLVGDKMFRKGANSARLSIHFMETPSEVDYFEKKGKMYDFILECDMTPDFLHYGGHVERLIESLPPDVPLLLVHNTMIERAQVERLKDYFTSLTFVLCPVSNYYIERAFPPALMLSECGVNVAIGTDSLTSNHALSMAREIEWLLRHNEQLPTETVLRWATQGGAIGLRAEHTIGTFEVGKSCGAVIVEGLDPVNFRPREDRGVTTKRIL